MAVKTPPPGRERERIKVEFRASFRLLSEGGKGSHNRIYPVGDYLSELRQESGVDAANQKMLKQEKRP